MHKNVVKIGCVVPEIGPCAREQTNTQTDKRGCHNIPLPYQGRSKNLGYAAVN